jgi:hypothetical protein
MMGTNYYVRPNMDNRYLLPGRVGQGLAPSGTSMGDPNDPLFQEFQRNQGYPASYRAGLAANSGYQAPGSNAALNTQIQNQTMQLIAAGLPGGGGAASAGGGSSAAGGGGAATSGGSASIPALPGRTDTSALQEAAKWRPPPLPAAPAMPGREAPPERIAAAPTPTDWQAQYRPGAAAPIRNLNPLSGVSRPNLGMPTMKAPGRLQLPASPVSGGPIPGRIPDRPGAPGRVLQTDPAGMDQMRSLIEAWQARGRQPAAPLLRR